MDSLTKLSMEQDDSVWATSLKDFCDSLSQGFTSYSETYTGEATANVCELLATATMNIAGLDDTKQFNEEAQVQILRAVRCFMCERTEFTKALLVPAALDAYFKICETEDRPLPVIDEALKCINNSHFDNPEAQVHTLNKKVSISSLIARSATFEDIACISRVCRICLQFFHTKGDEIVGLLMHDEAPFLRALIRRISSEFMMASTAAESGWRIVSQDAIKEPVLWRFLVDGLKLLYAVGATDTSALRKLEIQDQSKNTLTADQLNQILSTLNLSDPLVPDVDKLGLSIMHIIMADLETKEIENETARSNFEDVRSQAFSLLMFAAKVKGYAKLATSRGLVTRVCNIIHDRVNAMMPESTVDADGNSSPQESWTIPYDAFHHVGPAIIALHELCTSSNDAKAEAKAVVFSEELPPIDEAGKSEDEISKLKEKRRITGVTPTHVLGGKLTKFLTGIDSNLKRFTGELLYGLCDDSANEFTRLVGYGAGVHMMYIKSGMMGGVLAQQEQQRKQREEQLQRDAEQQ